MIVLEGRGLGKDFALPGAWPWSAQGMRRAVDAVDLALHRGEIVSLVGESGCGKSTLARLLVGLLAPTRGEVLLEGRPLGQWDRRQLTRRVQIVLQGPTLNPRLRIDQIVTEGLHGRGVGRAELRRRAALALRDVGLARLDPAQRPSQISGGQRQRVSIARALVLEPTVLVADEPTAALDTSAQAQILLLLRDLVRARGLALALVSHDLRAVLAFSDRIGVMVAGALVELVPAAQFVRQQQHPAGRALFEACMTIPMVGHNMNPGRPTPVDFPPCGERR